MYMEMAGHKQQHLLQYLLRNFSFRLLILIAHTTKALENPSSLSLNKSTTAPAVIVFGDSTVDPGNNNYVKTTFKANFPPYGKDFANQKPTGRFSNGRITPDFIVSYIGSKQFVPPYLDPTLTIEELMTGVSFASAGSGFDPLTPKLSNVVDIPTQLVHFKEYKKRLESAIGKERTEKHINKAVFIISAGTNDFVVNYFALPIRRKTYSVSGYQQFILQTAKQFLQDLFDQGARRILFTTLPPMGCLPVVITLFSNNVISKRGCIEYFSSVGNEFNRLLENELNLMQNQFANRGVKIRSCNTYKAMSNMIQGQQRSAFDDVNSGCCGTGYLEAGILCNPKSYLCPDASKYVFWDSMHPTEQAYYNVFNSIRTVIDDLIKD